MIRPDILTAPILPLMLRFAAPNLLAMSFTTAAATIETYYFGRLGVRELAGHAIVFPLIMLQHMMSAGALGGGVSSVVSRALGARNFDRARAVGLHALILGVLFGLTFAGGLYWAGTSLLQVLGANGDVLDFAWSYAGVVLFAIPGIWVMNSLTSVLRGSGQMAIPSALTISVAVLQMVLSGVLGFGLDYGIVGIAWGQVIAYGLGAAVSLVLLRLGPQAVRMSFNLRTLERRVLADIARVGGLACLSPIQSTLTAMFLTAYLSAQGAAAIAGYGIGARLEFLLIPIAFSVGIGTLPMVGMAVGAGDVARAKAAGWIGGAMGGAVLGIVGCIVALFPNIWSGLFTDEPDVLTAAAAYFQWAGPGYAFLGLGLCLYFASQGAGRVLWPILSGTLRLVLVAGLGWVLMRMQVPMTQFFCVVFIGMATFGLATALSIWKLDWTRALR